MAKLYYKDKHPIGLDISQTGIKVMAIDPKKLNVEGYGSLDLDPAKIQAAFDSSNDENTYLADAVAQLLNENVVGSLPSNHVVIGVPTKHSYSRTFSIPADQESHLQETVEIEVSQYIPIPLSALYVDYEVIERTKTSTLVVMSAIPRTVVDACMRAAVSSGLRPVMVEPSINAVARLIVATESGSLATLVIDIGQAYTDIAVLDKGSIRLSGGLSIGGNTFTIDIAKHLDTPLDRAHQLKVLNGLQPGPRQESILTALRPSLDRICSEVRKVIRYYDERMEGAVKIEQVLVVGAGSNMPGIGDFFTNELVLPARVASPWQHFNFGSLPQPNKQFRPRYISVAGLASIKSEDLWR